MYPKQSRDLNQNRCIHIVSQQKTCLRVIKINSCTMKCMMTASWRHYPSLANLVTTGSCIPAVHKEMESIIETISHVIMRQLLCVMPITNTGMLTVIWIWSSVCDHETNIYIHGTNTTRIGTRMDSKNDSKQICNSVTIVCIRS